LDIFEQEYITEKMESKTTRTVTSYETNSSNYDDDYGKQIRSSIQPRHLVIQRGGTPFGGGNSSMTMERSTRYSSNSGAPSLALQATGVPGVKSARDKEKKDMQDLNERFASYIEKVRFLEAQNRRLGDELEKLKSKWGKETTQIKGLYQAELDEAKRLLEEAQKEKSRLEMRIAALEDQLANLRSKLDEKLDSNRNDRDRIEQQNQQMSDIEAELNLLRRRAELLEGDREKAKRTISRLQDAMNRARIDIDNETLLQVDAENRRQALEDELEFLKSIHEQELKELTDLAYRDTTNENREFWKNEMGPALREIQMKYDDKMDALRNEMDTFYNLKVQEFRTGASRQNIDATHSKEETVRLKTVMTDLKGKLNDLEAKNAHLQMEIDMLLKEREDRERELQDENAQLKNDLASLRAELEAITIELREITDTKLGLELEIAAYRKLLEGEEDREGLKQIVDSMYSTMNQSRGERDDGPGINVSQSVRGNITAKTTYQRSAKGPVNIGECAADGSYISLENTSRKDENVGGWSIKRNVDGRDLPVCNLPSDLTLKAAGKVKLYARGKKPRDAFNDIETNQDTWEQTGSIITTKLCNPTGEDRATHIQKTVFN
jgi:intermediate filament protein if